MENLKAKAEKMFEMVRNNPNYELVGQGIVGTFCVTESQIIRDIESGISLVDYAVADENEQIVYRLGA